MTASRKEEFQKKSSVVNEEQGKHKKAVAGGGKKEPGRATQEHVTHSQLARGKWGERGGKGKNLVKENKRRDL